MGYQSAKVRSKKKRAQILKKKGRLQEAIALYEEICRRVPSDAATWYSLGDLYMKVGRYQEGVACCQRSAHAEPTFALTYIALGNGLSALGHTAEAADSYRKAGDLDPNSTQAFFFLGNTLQLMGQLDEAVNCYRRAIQLKKDFAFAYNNLGSALDELGNLFQAETVYRQALAINPDMVEAHNNLGVTLQKQGRLELSLVSFKSAIDLRPEYAEAHFGMGLSLDSLSRPEEAKTCFQQALAVQPSFEDALGGLAQVLDKQGKKEQALELLQSTVRSGGRNARMLAAYAGLASACGLVEDAIVRLEAAVGDRTTSVKNTHLLHYALGRLYDRCNDFDPAFTHFDQANRLQRRTFEVRDFVQRVDEVIDTFSSEFFLRAPCSGNSSQVPVFIVGMPRSGTTLVEQILAHHTCVWGAGELPYITDIIESIPVELGLDCGYPTVARNVTARFLEGKAQSYLQRLSEVASQAARITDKMPHNFQYLGLIAQLFPEARVIHCGRNPLDTCLSIYFHDFGSAHGYSNDLRHLGAYYQQYQKLMQHWTNVLPIPILELQYEELVDDPEAMIRTLLEFCGLEWEDNCLKFPDSGRYTATASYDQVRQPIYSRSVQRWKNYRKHIGALQQALNL